MRFALMFIFAMLNFVIHHNALGVSLESIPKHNGLNLAPHLQITNDPAGTFSPFQEELNSALSKSAPQASSIGYASGVWWAQFSLDNPTSTHKKVIIEFADSTETMAEVSFFIRSQNNQVRTIKTGGTRRPTPDTLDYRFIAVPIFIEPNSSVTIQVRIHGTAVRFPLYAHTERCFLHQNYHQTIWQGISYGVIILIGIYNLAVYLASKKHWYLFSAGFITLAGVILFAMDGFATQFLLHRYQTYNIHLISVSLNLSAALLLLFTSSYLELNTHSRGLREILNKAALLCALIALANVGTELPLATTTAITSASCLCLFAGISIFKRHPQLAISYLVPTLFLIVGVLLTQARLRNLVPSNAFTDNALRIGIILNALFWALALSIRFRFLTNEKFLAERRLLEKNWESETQKNCNLEKQIKLIADISLKLEIPLRKLIAGLAILQYQYQKLWTDQPLLPQSAQNQTNSPMAAFLKEWDKQQKILAATTERLIALSKALIAFKEAQEELQGRIFQEERK